MTDRILFIFMNDCICFVFRISSLFRLQLCHCACIHFMKLPTMPTRKCFSKISPKGTVLFSTCFAYKNNLTRRNSAMKFQSTSFIPTVKKDGETSTKPRKPTISCREAGKLSPGLSQTIRLAWDACAVTWIPLLFKLAINSILAETARKALEPDTSASKSSLCLLMSCRSTLLAFSRLFV